jgi:hypothetical protein
MSLLTPDESVTAGRIALSPLPEDAIATMPWLEAALAPEWTLQDFEVALKSSQAVLISDLEAIPMGLALVRLDTPGSRDATIVFLAMQPERRFRGLGGEAGLAVERLVRERTGAQRVFAGVTEGRGLAIYFWLRLGFRPLRTAEGPIAALGLAGETLPGVWMLRDQV